MQFLAVHLTAPLMYHHCKVKAVHSDSIPALMTAALEMSLGHHAALLAFSEQYLVLQWL